MDDHELERLFDDLESDRTERKASLSDRNDIRQAICAFANDLPNHQQPGVLFIGVNNDGSCAGLPITDQLLLTLSQMKDDGNILPFPSLIVQKKTLRGCELAVIVVEPADAPPVRFHGRVWIRVGPRRATATPEEERRLAEKRRSKDLPFDIHSIRSASLQDLDLDYFRREVLPNFVSEETLEQNQRSVEQQLLSLRFTSVDPPFYPTVVGLMVTGLDPRQYLPGGYIQFLRLDGTLLSDPIKDQKEVDGPLPEMLRRLDEIFEAHISTETHVSSVPVEIRRPDYPITALQQLARNAVLHRNYEGTNSPVRLYWFEDHIEIHSPGGPFGQVNPLNFGKPGVTDYRNPHLAEAMKDLGYVQRFGIGIPLAREELKKNGNPPPEFVVEDNHVLVILRRRQ